MRNAKIKLGLSLLVALVLVGFGVFANWYLVHPVRKFPNIGQRTIAIVYRVINGLSNGVQAWIDQPLQVTNPRLRQACLSGRQGFLLRCRFGGQVGRQAHVA